MVSFGAKQGSYSPITGIAKISVDRTVGQLGDYGHSALILGSLDFVENVAYELLLVACVNKFGYGETLVYHEVQELVDLFIGKAKLALVGLSVPKIGTRRFFDYFIR